MKSQSNGIGRAISGVVIFTLAAKLMGFFREIILSFYFGATGVSDAYLISQTIPGTIFQFVGTGLMTCFIPVYYQVQINGGDVKKYTNKILTVVFLFSTAVIFLVWAFTPAIVKLFASGFEGETLYYAVWFTRIGILSLYFSAMIYVYNSYLNANNIFIATAFAAIPNSLVIILSIICGAKINLWLLSIGSTLAVAVQLLFILPSVLKTGYRLRINFNLNDEYIKKFFVLMGPVIVGVSVNEINTLVDRTVASQVAIGGISALTYANSLIQFVQGGLVQPVATVYYPKITESVSHGKIDDAKKSLVYSLGLILGLLIPISVGFMIFSRPITELLFGRGAFDETAIVLTSTAVRFYALGICFVGIREFLSRYFYANSNTKTPMINATFGMFINIVLNIVLSKLIGIAGLAIATSTSAIVTASLLLRDTKKIPHGSVSLDFRELSKILVDTILMGIVSALSYSIIPGGNLLRLTVSVLLAVFVYFIFGWYLKLEIMDYVRSLFKSMKNRYSKTKG